MNMAWAGTGHAWEWFAIAGLGIFHGINPAMGWLFAVALGLHRRSRQAVLLAIPPMALGHALSIGIVAALVLTTGGSLIAISSVSPAAPCSSPGRCIRSDTAIGTACVLA
jgi:hypothetical protein